MRKVPQGQIRKWLKRLAGNVVGHVRLDPMTDAPNIQSGMFGRDVMEQSFIGAVNRLHRDELIFFKKRHTFAT